VAGSLLLQILREQVSVHLCLEQVDPWPVEFFDVLCRLGVELECGEDDHLWLGYQLSGLLYGKLNLALLHGCVLVAKRNYRTLGQVFLSFRVGMEPSRCGQWFNPRKVNSLTASTADSEGHRPFSANGVSREESVSAPA